MFEREALVQHRLHLAPRVVAVAVAAHEHVRRERREAAGDFPYVQVVNLDDAGLADERRADRLRIEAFGRGLEEDPPGRAHEREPRARHQRGDQQRDDRVGALEARQQDHGGGDRGADEPVQVGQQVLKGALDVEALAVGPRERPRRGEVDEHADERDGEDQPASHDRRVEQAADALIRDERRQDQQRHAVGLRREDLHAPQAEGHGPLGRSRGKPDGDQREADRRGVGEHVPGV